jgi:hypothetical protein
MAQITRQEWRRAVGFALFVIILTTIPYVIAFARQDGAWTFSGSLIGVEDGNSYLAKMRLGARGEWNFYLFYTPEPTEGAPLLFLPYIAVGQIVGRLVSPEQLPTALKIAFQIMRIVCDFLLILAIYRFAAQFIKSEKTRYHALILTCLGGGVGWITLFIGVQPNPPEMYIPEGFGFLVLFSLPHVALARAALLMGFVLIFPDKDAPQEHRYSRRVIFAGLLWCIVGLCVPFYFAVIYVLLGVWGLAAWIIPRRFPTQLFWRALIAALITLPLFIYYTVIFSTNPAFAQWSAQNILTSPPPLDYVLAYLPLGVLAILAARLIFKRARRRNEHALLIGWLIAAPMLVYLPINVQRRLGEGVIVPLAVCAALGLRSLLGESAIRKWGVRLALGAACFSVVLILATTGIAALTLTRPAFIPNSQIRAFEWLRQNAQTDEIVLAAWETGNALPVYTSMRPFVGIGPETLRAEAKDQNVTVFFRDEMESDSRESLMESTCVSVSDWAHIPQAIHTLGRDTFRDLRCRITYIFYGDIEHEIAGENVPENPLWIDGLELIYDEDDIQIYHIPDIQIYRVP